jgi:hypothetical protein
LSQHTPQPGDSYPQQPAHQPPAGQQPGYVQPAYEQQPGYVQPAYQQQPAYYQQPYVQPMYQQTITYAAYRPQPKAFSVTSLVLGLVSIFFGFTFLVPIGAIVFGIIGIKREPAVRGMSITGLILGGLCLLGWVVLVVLWFVFVVFVTAAAASAGTYTS